MPFDAFPLVFGLMFLGGYAVDSRWFAVVGAICVVLSDLVIGNELWLTVTMALGMSGAVLFGNVSRAGLGWFAGSGVSILIYDLITNFAIWLGPWYPNSVAGLGLCYLNALPFMAWHMIGGTVVAGVAVGCFLGISRLFDVRGVWYIEN